MDKRTAVKISSEYLKKLEKNHFNIPKPGFSIRLPKAKATKTVILI